MTWLVYSLISLLSFSVYEILSRSAGVNSKNPRVFSALYSGLVAIFSIGLFLLEPLPTISINFNQGLTMIFLVGLWVAFCRLEYYAHKYTEASTLAVIIKIGPIITFVLSSLFFKEAVTLQKIMGMIVLLVAAYLVSAPENGKLVLNRGTIYTMILAVVLGITWTMDKAVSPWFGVSLYTVMTFGVPAVINALTPPITKRELADELKGMKVQLLALAALTATGFGSMMKALSLGEASRVIPVATSTAPLVVLLAAIFLKERRHLPIKIAATLMIMVGIGLLG